MTFTLSATLNSDERTLMKWYYDREELILDTTYFKSEIPKSRISEKYDPNQVFELFGVLDSVLSANQLRGDVKNFDSKTVIVFQLNESKSVASKMYTLRLENMEKSRFTQLTSDASKFHSLREYLRLVLARLL